MTDLDGPIPEFSIALRGYDRVQVDQYIRRLQRVAEEAAERTRRAEAPRDPDEHTQIGPRITTIFELAQAEASDLREAAQAEALHLRETARVEARDTIEDARTEARDTLEAARREARETVEAARREVGTTMERHQDEWDGMLDEYEAERDRLRTEVHQLQERRAHVIGELRRLRETLGLASGIVDTAPLDAEAEWGEEEGDPAEQATRVVSAPPPDEHTLEFEVPEPRGDGYGN